MKLFWNDLKRAIVSWGFLAAVLGTCAVYLAGAWVDLQGGINDVLYYYSVSSRLGDFTKLLPLLCVLPYAVNYVSEWNHNVVRYAVVRSNQTRYALSKAVTTAISGGLALALGLTLFLVLLALRFPLADSVTPGFSITPGGGYRSLLDGQQYIFYYLFHVIQLFFWGAFWAMVALLLSAYIPNLTVTVCGPFIFFYFLRVLFTALHIPGYLNVTSLYQGAFRLTESAGLNLLFVSCYLLALTAVLAGAFVHKSKRRLSHA